MFNEKFSFLKVLVQKKMAFLQEKRFKRVQKAKVTFAFEKSNSILTAEEKLKSLNKKCPELWLYGIKLR